MEEEEKEEEEKEEEEEEKEFIQKRSPREGRMRAVSASKGCHRWLGISRDGLVKTKKSMGLKSAPASPQGICGQAVTSCTAGATEARERVGLHRDRD